MTPELINLRDWLRAALESAGGQTTGSGVGCNFVDIELELQGCRFDVTIKPIIRAPVRKCGTCWTCLDGRRDEVTGREIRTMYMILCETCGNKRCPHATDCALRCTDSNESGQPGSRYSRPPE